MEKKFMKSTNKRWKGVCGGIAEYFNLDPTIVRALYAILTFGTSWFHGIILYIILAICMPNAPEERVVRNS